MKHCTCEIDWYEFQIDENGQGWIRCEYCGDNMFEEGIGVILINWATTNPKNLRVEIKEDGTPSREEDT